MFTGMNVAEIPPDAGPLLVVGEAEVASAVARAATAAGVIVVRLKRPGDAELRRVLDGGATAVASVAVVSRDDIEALRLALVIEHMRPGIRLLVTIFDRSVAGQLRRSVPNCRVMSLADATAPAFTGPCVQPDLLALDPPSSAVRVDGTTGEAVPSVWETRRPGWPTRIARRLQRQFRPYDPTSRVMLVALAGLFALAVGEILLTAVGLDESLIHAVYDAVKVMSTVGPNPIADKGPEWLQVYSSVSMVAGIALIAAFTAGLVDRLLSQRLSAIVGARTIPRSRHVIVVGLGQVGLRLCGQLRAAGVDVVAVERDPNAANMPLARHLGIPVVIGRGGDRLVLERLSVRRTRALAAVTSDELENIAVAVTALATHPAVRVVLRAGTDDVTAETQSLFDIGIALDADALAGACLAALALGIDAQHGLAHRDRTYLRLTNGRIIAFP